MSELAGGPPSAASPSPPAAANARRAKATTEARHPHAPATTRGWLRRLLGPFYFTGAFWYRIHLVGVRVLPDRLMGPMLLLFAAGFFLALGRVRRGVARNLDAVLGPARGIERLRRSWRTVYTWSWVLTERYEQFVPRKRFDVSIEGLELWEELARAGQGFVMVTAHVGAWEVGSTVPALRRGTPIHLVREPELDPGAQEFVEELLADLGGQRYVTHFATDDASLGVELLAALRRGEIVALQGDRPRAGGRSLRMELFGLPFDLPVGTAALARLSGAPLVPVFTLREGRRRYRIHVHPPIAVPRTADREADHRAALTALATHLERAIRDHPHQWFCFHDLRAGP